MRYQEIENIVFENKDGNSFTIKDMREFPDYTLLAEVEIDNDDMVDEVASRPEIFGAESEGQSFKIVDYNIIKIFEARFDLTKLEKLRIPNP